MRWSARRLSSCLLVSLLLGNVNLSSQAVPPALLAYPFAIGSFAFDRESSAYTPSSRSTTDGAVCQDGSAAVLYYRNCSANWDRKPGGPDYCNVSNVRWIIVFQQGPRDELQSPLALTSAPNAGLPQSGDTGDFLLDKVTSGAFCYDAASCLSRNINFTTSAGLPETAFPGGIGLPYAEANPDLYKSHHVFVPYCSSDLWAGNASTTFDHHWHEVTSTSHRTNGTPASTAAHFRGREITVNVLKSLFLDDAISANGNMATANSVLIIGGAGIMAHIDEYSQLLLSLKRQATGNQSAVLDVLGMCDGCLIFSFTTPSIVNESALCTSDSDCPPSLALPQAQSLWNLQAPSWCNELQPWMCYTAAPLLDYLTHTAETKVLVQASQYDRIQLASYGLWPAAAVNGSDEQGWAESTFAPAVRTAAASTPYSFTAACDRPSPLSLIDAYYHTLVRYVDQYNHTRSNALTVAVPSFLEDAAAGSTFGPGDFGTYSDNCTTFDCNLSACGG